MIRSVISGAPTDARSIFMEAHGGILRGALASKTGCNLETIRYYEKVGLLPAPPRSANGYRVYPPQLVQRLQFILHARDLGFAMEEIRSLFSLPDTGAQTCSAFMAKTQTPLATIPYEEKVGLLPAPPRSANGYRVYPPQLVQRLQFILHARDLGFAMEEIRSLLSLTDTGAQTCAEVMAKTQVHLEDVQRKITDLQRIERTLSRTLAECSGENVPECAILEALQFSPV